MASKERWIRLGRQLFSLVCIAAVLAPATQAQEGGTTTVTIHKAECPPGYAGFDFFADCHANTLGGVAFEWGAVAPGPLDTVRTDNEGVAVIETTAPHLGLGIFEQAPFALSRYVVYCSKNDGNEVVSFNYVEDDIGIIFPTLTSGEPVLCDWYNIPPARDGDRPGEPTTLPSTATGTLTSQVGDERLLWAVAAGTLLILGFGWKRRCRRVDRPLP